MIVGNKDVSELVFTDAELTERGDDGVLYVSSVACRVKNQSSRLGLYEIYGCEDILVGYGKRVGIFVDLF